MIIPRIGSGPPTAEVAAKRMPGSDPPEGRFKVRQVLCLNTLFTRKGHEIVASLFFHKNGHAPLITIPVILFFVRVNQVLVRLWARVISLAVRCGVVGIPTTDRRSPITDSAAPVDV